MDLECQTCLDFNNGVDIGDQYVLNTFHCTTSVLFPINPILISTNSFSFSLFSSSHCRIDKCLNLNGQLSGGCTFFFDGWSDNLLLSKTPLLNTDFLLYNNSPLAQWTVLYAQVYIYILE